MSRIMHKSSFERLAILTSVEEKSRALAWQEDEAIISLLKSEIDCEYLPWNHDFSKGSFSHVLIKSTWDYIHEPENFLEKLRAIKALGVQLINPLEHIEFNSDKKYLFRLAESFPVIETLNYDPLKPVDFYRQSFNCDDLVIKPRISAGSYQTWLLRKSQDHDTLLRGIACSMKDFIVQPFIPEIKDGEFSLVFIGGVFSHSVKKTPRAGDFRSQPEFGSMVHFVDLSNEIVSMAGEVVNQFASDCFHARVDGIITREGFKIIELELIEPSLFLQNDILQQRYTGSLLARLQAR